MYILNSRAVQWSFSRFNLTLSEHPKSYQNVRVKIVITIKSSQVYYSALIPAAVRPPVALSAEWFAWRPRGAIPASMLVSMRHHCLWHRVVAPSGRSH